MDLRLGLNLNKVTWNTEAHRGTWTWCRSRFTNVCDSLEQNTFWSLWFIIQAAGVSSVKSFWEKYQSVMLMFQKRVQNINDSITDIPLTYSCFSPSLQPRYFTLFLLHFSFSYRLCLSVNSWGLCIRQHPTTSAVHVCVCDPEPPFKTAHLQE